MVTLTPVAPQQPRRVKLRPVTAAEAAPALPPEDIRGPDGVPGSTPAAPRPATPPLGPLRSLQYGTQKVGSGIANLLGAPVDITTALGNALVAGVDMIPGVDASPYYTTSAPVLGSEWIKGLLSGVPSIDEASVPPQQRIAGNITDFATQALLGGTALASNAARQSASPLVRSLAAPYAQNAARTVSGDVAAGVGAGATTGAYQEATPQDQQNPLIETLLALGGGIGGITGKAALEGTGRAMANTGKSLVGRNFDPMVGADEATGYRPTASEVEQAARRMQAQALNPQLAARNIEESTAAMDQFAPRGAQPTTGLKSNDPGLIVFENARRPLMAPQMIDRDRAVNSFGRRLFEQTAPADANPRELTDTAAYKVNRALEYQDRIAGEKKTRVDNETAARRQQIEAGRPQPVPLDQFRGEGAAASGRLKLAFEEEYKAARNEKNARYNDPALRQQPVDPQPLYDAVESLGQNTGPLAPRPELPAGIAERVKGLAETDPDTGDVIGFKNITFGDVLDLRVSVADELKAARAAAGRGESGSGPRVAALTELKATLDDYAGNLADPSKAENAIGYYRDQYAPRFKQGQAGAYTRDMASGNDLATRPEDFAGRFLGANKGSDVESLNRAIRMNEVPERAADARAFLMDRLAGTNVVDKDGLLKPEVMKAWYERNVEVVKRVPGMQQEIVRMLNQAVDGKRMTGKIAEDLKALDAEAKGKKAEIDNLAATNRREIERSVLGRIRDKNPRNAINEIMNSGDPERDMAMLADKVKPDPKMRDGAKAALRDWLIDKTRTTAVQNTLDGEAPASFAKLDKLLAEHEKTLAQLYEPDEMNALRQVHTLFKPMNNKSLRASVGSDTNEKGFQMARALEAGLKLRYGVLKGGGIMRTLRVAAESLPNSDRGVENIIVRAHFDPDLAKHLLTKDTRDVDTPEWNAKLNKLLGVAAAGREMTDGESR